LRVRKAEQDIFTDGDYNPVDVQGSRRDHVFAFSRAAGARRAVIAVPRLVATLTPNPDVAPLGERIWGDTQLVIPGLRTGGLHNAITDSCVSVDEATGTVRAADVFEQFPVAILLSDRDG
jgi:(1->4)-alpha-D-glucan 1-alpha-D-glucosylmutase